MATRNTEIQEKLRALLPHTSSNGLNAITEIISHAIEGRISVEEANNRLSSSSDFRSLLVYLAGKELKSRDTIISFGDDSQLGDIKIGNVASGDIITLNVSMVVSEMSEEFTRFSKKIDDFTQRTVWSSTILLAFIIVGLVSMIAGYFNPSTLSIWLFLLGALVNLSCLALFVFVQISGPLKAIKALRENQALLDSIQDLSLRLVDTTNKLQSFLFLYVDKVSHLLETTISVVQEIPGFQKIDFTPVTNANQLILQTTEGSQKIIQDIKLALMEGNAAYLQKYAPELDKVSALLKEALIMADTIKNPLEKYEHVLSIAQDAPVELINTMRTAQRLILSYTERVDSLINTVAPIMPLAGMLGPSVQSKLSEVVSLSQKIKYLSREFDEFAVEYQQAILSKDQSRINRSLDILRGIQSTLSHMGK